MGGRGGNSGNIDRTAARQRMADILAERQPKAEALQDLLQSRVGRQIENDGRILGEMFVGGRMVHQGNFEFRAVDDGLDIRVQTKPIGERNQFGDYERIQVTSVRVNAITTPEDFGL